MTTDHQTVLIEPDAASVAISARIRRAANKAPAPPASPEAQEWLALERRRRDLEAQLKTLVTQQDRARQRLLDAWSMAGLDREKVDGHTVHLRRKLYPKVADKARLAEALKREGLDDLLTVDEKAFAIYVTACDEEGRPLPEPVAAHTGESFERWDLAVKLK